METEYTPLTEDHVKKTAEFLFKKTFPDKEIKDLSVRKGAIWWTAFVMDIQRNEYHFSVDRQTILEVTGAY